MDSALPSGRRFGPFELSPATGELRKNGIRIKLPKQAFQLLLLLTERAGELVSREDIRLALWPNETVVEWEHSINTAVKRIRSALGDTTEKPIYIETLRGRGYRFIGSVEASHLRPVSRPPSVASPRRQAEPRKGQVPVGGEISHYRIIEAIGSGGMGIVYRAEDLRLGRQVALKFLPLDRVDDPVAVGRFEREARTASILNHPNICTIYDVEVETLGAFIAMELLEGESLHDRIERAPGTFSTAQLFDLGIQVADALDAAHEQNIIHRDIKPANIFLTRRGEAKVLDFGLAKPAPRRLHSPAFPGGGEFSSGDLTSTGGAPGTPAYMSPEQARAEELDARTDLYSFGAVLYEAATGRQAFHEFPDTPLRPEEAARHPQKFWELTARLLERERDLRYQTAGDVASELRRLKRDLSGSSTAAPPAPKVEPALVRRAPRLWIGVASGLLALLILGASAWWMFQGEKAAGPLPLPEILTSDPGNQVAGDFSPDGKEVVYSWNGTLENNYDLYVLTIGGGPPRRLTSGKEVDYSPAWSPDGTTIAFLKGVPEGIAALWLIPASGGTARKLTDTSMHVDPRHRRIEWSPDGRWIVMEGEPASDQTYALTAVSVASGERHKLTNPGPNQGDLQPAISPDGHKLVFVRDVGNGVGILELLPLTAGMTAREEPQPIHLPKFESITANAPRWLNGGRELIFTSNRGGSGRLWRTVVEDHPQPVMLASMGDHISFPAVSRDGKRLLFSRLTEHANIWSTSVGTPANAPPQLAPSTASDSVPDFSPDGSEIVFDSERSGATEIWISKSNGSSPRQLTNYGGPGTGSPRWSPDGKWIAYDSRVEGQPDIYVIPSAGGAPQRLTKDPAADVMPVWSPDGRWLYFCSGRSGAREVWRTPSQGGNAEQITRTGGCSPRITPDGKTIYYMKRTASIASLWKAPAEGGEEILVLNNVVDRCFAVTKGRLYYVTQSSDDSRLTLRYLDLASHKIEVVRALTGQISPRIAISPDGKNVLYREVDRHDSNLMLIDHFH